MTVNPSRLAQELGQRRPFRSKSQEGMIALWRTADLLQRRFEALVAPHGVTRQQYNVLRILRGAEPDGLPTLTIAERMIERSPGITRLLDRLERRTLVRRTRSATDRRQVVCRITRSGLGLLAELDPAVDAMDEAALAALAPAEQARLVELLDAIRADTGTPAQS